MFDSYETDTVADPDADLDSLLADLQSALTEHNHRIDAYTERKPHHGT